MHPRIPHKEKRCMPVSQSRKMAYPIPGKGMHLSISDQEKGCIPISQTKEGDESLYPIPRKGIQPHIPSQGIGCIYIPQKDHPGKLGISPLRDMPAPAQPPSLPWEH